MISSLFGLLGFLGTVYYVIFLSGEEKFTGFYNQTALILLVCGPIFVEFISRGLADFLGALKATLSLTFFSNTRQMRKIANELTVLGQGVRSQGMGILATAKNDVKHPLFKDGLALILNGFSSEEIRHNIMAKINIEQIHLSQAVSLFSSLGKLAPGMGLIGTLVGLVHMLANLSDPSKIGPGMAVSLLATLYGLLLANAIYIPIAEKIEVYAEKRLQLESMILEGVLLLKEKKSAAHVKDVIVTYSTAKNINHNEVVAGKNS